MSALTIELYKVIAMRDGKIGLDDYPIFDDDYRESLNQKIIDHYNNREIGHESIEQFIFAMRRKMNEIMPLYNQLYESQKLQFDPLSTVKIENVSDRVGKQTTEGQSVAENTSDADSKTRSVNSAFPQSFLGEGDNGDYATGAADSTGVSTSAGSSTTSEDGKANSEETGTSSTSGYQGLPSDMLMRYRASFLNIDMNVIAELNELFMSIWQTSEPYSNNQFYGGFYY